jgi:SP family sugar:H+ symporter-like MFS transporter
MIGYDTGQISQILLLEGFINRFGQVNDQGQREFQSIVSSLLVSLMSIVMWAAFDFMDINRLTGLCNLGALVGALLGSYTMEW